MNRFLLILALVVCSLVLPAQTYFRVGYVANHYNMMNYDKMIDRYNETRPWLTTKMPYMKWMTGPDIGIGVRFDNGGGGEFFFRTAWATVSASGTDSSGVPTTRYLQAKEGGIGGVIYVRVAGPVYMSFDGEISVFKSKTKVDAEDYRLKDKTFSIGITPGHIYYACPFVNVGHENTWAELDPNNFANEDKKIFFTHHRHFGVGVSFELGRPAEN